MAAFHTLLQSYKMATSNSLIQATSHTQPATNAFWRRAKIQIQTAPQKSNHRLLASSQNPKKPKNITRTNFIQNSI